MATISFKNVGLRVFQAENSVSSSIAPKPIGIKTPLEIGRNSEGIFRMHFDVADQIHDNLQNLILTNHGERLALYDFGANLRPLLSEFSNEEDFNSEATVRIASTVAKYMPFINLVDFTAEPQYYDNQFVGRIKIAINYSVNSLNVFNRGLEVMLYVI